MRKTVAQALGSLEKRVTEGFAGVDRRLDGIDGRLDAHDRRFDRIDGRLDTIDGRLDAHDGRFDKIDGRLDTHGGRFDKIDGQFVVIARRFDAVDQRLVSLGVSVDELRAEMYGHFDAVYQRLDRLETEYHMLVAGIRRIEAQMAEDRNDRAQLHAQVSDLRERVKQLEERLRELQERLDAEPEPEPPPSKPS